MVECLWLPLRQLAGCADGAAALGAPVAEIYVRAAEVSLEQAIAALERMQDDARYGGEEPYEMDAGLLDWMSQEEVTRASAARRAASL